MTIYMIRHGQTDWNADLRLQGQKDIPLNETGRRQASGNGRALLAVLGARADQRFDFVSSPMHRTRETMDLMRAAMGLHPSGYRIDERLKEFSFGDWEGHTMEELQQETPDRVAERELSKWHFIPPGADAESYEILSWRVAAWLSDVSKPTVCVSHGGVIRTLFKLCGAVDAEEAAMADIPQDRILKIENDAIGWI